jgi:hypothetical protein
MDLKKIALACGSVGGVEVTEDDVRNALLAKNYSRLVGRDGLLPPMEMARLKKAVRHAIAQRLVDEEFEKQTKLERTKLQAAPKQIPIASGTHTTMGSWRRAHNYGVAMAAGKPSMSPKAQAAWDEFLRGPMWLRENANAV